MAMLDAVLDELVPARPEARAALRALVADPTGGGLNGLIERFDAAGVAHVAESWVGNGPNLPVSPHELQEALGEPRVTALAGIAGLSPPSFLAELARLLPALVDRLTPEGRVPEGGHVDAAAPAPEVAIGRAVT